MIERKQYWSGRDTQEQRAEDTLRFLNSSVPKPFITLTGTLAGIDGDLVGLLHDGDRSLISFSRLSLVSQSEAVEKNVGLTLTLKVRG